MTVSVGGTGTSQSLERGLAILSSFGSDRPLIGVSELSRRARPEPEHRSPLYRDARAARLPPAGCRLEALPARPASARSRVLGDQLDGPAGDLRSAPAPAQRRDAAHREPGDPRRHRCRLHRALPYRATGAARDRPQPPRRSEAAGLLHGDGKGDPGVSARGAARGDHREDRLRAARPEHVDERRRRFARSWFESAPSVSR